MESNGEDLRERLVVEIPPAEVLKGTRLGKLMRRYLLDAMPYGSRDIKYIVHGPNRVVAGARALRDLRNKGLVVVAEPRRIELDPLIWGRDWTRASAVRRTELGELVVNTFREELESGRRIRWEKLPSAETQNRVR